MARTLQPCPRSSSMRRVSSWSTATKTGAVAPMASASRPTAWWLRPVCWATAWRVRRPARSSRSARLWRIGSRPSDRMCSTVSDRACPPACRSARRSTRIRSSQRTPQSSWSQLILGHQGRGGDERPWPSRRPSWRRTCPAWSDCAIQPAASGHLPGRQQPAMSQRKCGGAGGSEG